MNGTTFNLLLGLIREGLSKLNTITREAIDPEERLIATLRFLATGRSYKDLKYSVEISAQTLRYLIPKTCYVIFDVLKEKYMRLSL